MDNCICGIVTISLAIAGEKEVESGSAEAAKDQGGGD